MKEIISDLNLSFVLFSSVLRPPPPQAFVSSFIVHVLSTYCGLNTQILKLRRLKETKIVLVRPALYFLYVRRPSNWTRARQQWYADSYATKAP